MPLETQPQLASMLLGDTWMLRLWGKAPCPGVARLLWKLQTGETEPLGGWQDRVTPSWWDQRCFCRQRPLSKISEVNSGLAGVCGKRSVPRTGVTPRSTNSTSSGYVLGLSRETESQSTAPQWCESEEESAPVTTEAPRSTAWHPRARAPGGQRHEFSSPKAREPEGRRASVQGASPAAGNPAFCTAF